MSYSIITKIQVYMIEAECAIINIMDLRFKINI